MYDYTPNIQPKDVKENPFSNLHLKLIVPFEAYRQIISYAQLAGDIEISGFADVEYNNKAHEFTVGEVYLPEQHAGGTDVHIEEEDMAKFNLDLIKKGKKQLPQLWWHSHVDMEAFFSGTDETTLKELQNDTYIIALVVNKRGEMHAKMYIYTETKLTVVNALMGKETEEATEQIEIDPFPVQVKLTDKDIQKGWKDDVKKKLEDRSKTKLPYKNPFTFWSKDDSDPNRKIIIPGNYTKNSTEKKANRRKETFVTVVDEDFESRYTSNVLVKVYRLPADRKKAEKKIDDLNLIKTYNMMAHEYAYEDPETGDIWVDWWKVMPTTIH